MFEALRFGNQGKGCAVFFQISVNVLHADGISLL